MICARERGDNMSILFHPLSDLENTRIYFKHIRILEHRDEKSEDGTHYYVVKCPDCGSRIRLDSLIPKLVEPRRQNLRNDKIIKTQTEVLVT